MNFLKNIQDSIYSPEFYSNILKKSFKQSIGYFLLLILLLTTIRIIFLINPLLIETPIQLKKFAQDTINCYPKDLEIKITNGKTAVNVKEPYFIASCGSNDNQNMVIIDTKTPFSAEKFNEFKVAAWITKDSVVYKRNNLETRSYSFANIKNFKLNREVLNSYQTMFLPYLKFVGPILVLLAFTGTYLSYDFRLIHLLIIAALILVLGKAFKQNLGFGQSYKLGLYAMTLGLGVDLVVDLTARWTHFYGFPFMVTILTLAVVLVNYLKPTLLSRT